MNEIGIDAAEAGMVLAADLKDGGGNVLLPGGATLTAATIKSLARRGVETLAVVPQASDADAAQDAAARQAERERQCARLARLFRRSSDTDATGELLERLYLYRCTSQP
ncbi:MAG: hypothetical protein V4463_11845 [Pseudomonadota bacterium]